MKRKVSLGTVSHATMREQDLVPCFLDTLAELSAKRGREARAEFNTMVREWEAAHPGESAESDDSDFWTTEEMSYFLNETLFDALNELAPAYCYFGAHEGDGSDYGFWPSHDSLSDAEDVAKIGPKDSLPDARKARLLRNDGIYYIAETNDHGNLTLWHILASGQLREEWAIV